MNSVETPARRFFNAQTIGLAVVMLLGALLRFHDLDRTVLWFDESVSWKQASLPFLEMLKATATDNYPPLHNVILHFVIRLFGDSETALRAPSALFGLINIYVIYRIGGALWNKKTGLLAAFLLAISGFHIWHSIDARMYTLLALFASLFVWTAVELLRRPSGWWLAGNLLSAIALLYSHIFGSVIFCSLNLFGFLLYRRQAILARFPWKGWLWAQIAAGLSFLPWALIVLNRFAAVKQGFWIPESTSYQVTGELAVFLGGPVPALVTCLLAGLAFVDVSSSRLPLKIRLRPDPALLLLTVWLLSSVVFALTVSKISFPMFISRYLLGGLPALYLLAANGLSKLDGPGARVKIALTVTALLLAFPAWRYSFVQQKYGADLRSAISLLRDLHQPGEPVFVSRRANLSVITYYARHEPGIIDSVARLETSVRHPPEDYRYWVVVNFRERKSEIRGWSDVVLNALGGQAYWTYIGWNDSIDLTPLLETHVIASIYERHGIRLYLFARRPSSLRYSHR